MNYIRWFHEIDVGQIDLVGGKGANLGEMARANFPIPPGFSVIAPAYREVMEATGLFPIIKHELDQLDVDDPVDVGAKAGYIRQRISQQPIPVNIAQSIIDGYRMMGQELSSRSDPIPVAVRSSATAEDLPTASFAGQQDTYLNVRGEQALLEHIRACWASLWTDRAIIYREKHGFDHHKVSVSVVVQAMIESEISGILFTANPVSGNPNEVVINASWGLGEAIVSGLVSPDTLTVNKQKAKVIARHLASKDKMIIYADEGTATVDTPESKRGAPAIADEHAVRLAMLANRIEKHYGRAQDIEWAYADGHWYILQSRPITTLETQGRSFADEGEYNRSMMVEIFPDALSPSFLSVVCPLLENMLAFTMQTMGFKPPAGVKAVCPFYSQPYFHRDYIELALEPLSPAVRDSLVNQVVNPFGDKHNHAKSDLSRPYVMMGARMLWFMLRFPKQLPKLLTRYQQEVASTAEIPLDQAGDQDIVDRIRFLVFEAASRLLNNDFLLIALIGRAHRILELMLKDFYGHETAENVSKLLSGVTGNITVETNKGIWDLAQLAKASPEVSGLIRDGDGQELIERLQELQSGRLFLQELDNFLQEFGHREFRLDIVYPTWGEDPAPVFGFIRSYLDADEEQSPYRQQERLVRERTTLTAEIRDRLAADLKGRFLWRPLFLWLLNYTQILTRERDTMHFEWTRLFPPMRRFLWELGRRWREAGFLDDEEDIFYLHFSEIEEMAKEPVCMSTVVKQRREMFELDKERIWPDIIRDGYEYFLGTAPEAIDSGQDLSGVAGSPGLITSRSCVVRGPEEFSKLRKGDILVAPLTNPVWTPLFAVAGGLVTEVGGILSHGAIVAREYGIPAVMSVAGATRHIADGQTITVDGSRGVVYLEEEATR